MKNLFLLYISVISALSLTSCSKKPTSSPPVLLSEPFTPATPPVIVSSEVFHRNCLELKIADESKVYGVSNVWSQEGKRYALVTHVSGAKESFVNGQTIREFFYDESSTGIVRVSDDVPISSEAKIEFLKLVGGKWHFKK